MSVTEPLDVGMPIPKVSHPVSVWLPTWDVCVAGQEGESWVIDKLKYGYPRYYHNPKLLEYMEKIVAKHGGKNSANIKLLVFRSQKAAKECFDLIQQKSEKKSVDVTLVPVGNFKEKDALVWHVLFPEDERPHAMLYWRMSGQGLSSREAEYYLEQSVDSDGGQDHELDASNASKTVIMDRIADLLKTASEEASNAEKLSVSGSDVYLYPTGMAAIYNAHQLLLSVSSTPKKSVCFGFPFVDTLGVLKTFGPGVIFLGLGDDESLDKLEDDLKSNEVDIMALWCETPSNPLLKMPNLKRIRKLADKYDFAVVCDDTLGNFSNIFVLQYADILVTSLTKLFSGACDVMGGSLVLNPNSKLYPLLKQKLNDTYEDLLFSKDAAILEVNSRDFKSRSERINNTTLELVELLNSNAAVSHVFYPSLSPSKKYYDDVKTLSGGYGGLFSIVFDKEEDAKTFYDNLDVFKGPSLGTNFTLACPYTVLAHYKELDDIKKWGVPKCLVRVSVGLEDASLLKQVFLKSLDMVVKSNQ